jgi:hypothetical protein
MDLPPAPDIVNDASPDEFWIRRLPPGWLRTFAFFSTAYVLLYFVLFSTRVVEYARDVVRTFDFVRRWIG